MILSIFIRETAIYLSHPRSHRPQAATLRCADAPGRAMQLPRVRAVSENQKLRYKDSSACLGER